MARHYNRQAFARWQVPLICLVLAALTLAVFGQTAGFGFVNYDDGFYVYHNAKVAGGLSLKNLAWVFTHADCSLYHPLTMLSLMADYQLHGLSAGGYHLTNVLLHTASVILLFLVLWRMTGAVWRSAFVAAVFAIHPLRVESVAWVAERKDVLGTFFFMVTLGAYAHYVRNPKSWARYLMVAAAFTMALLSKPTAVTLPFLLLLLDFWPLQRTDPPRRLILEKIPLLALSAAACVMTMVGAGGEIAAYAHVPLPARIANASVSYIIYLRQIFWPQGLAVFYPRPEHGYAPWMIVFSVLALALVTGGVWALRRRQRWLLVGWLWYLGMLMPMIGLVQAGAFAHADRMTYLPQIGAYIALVWLVAEWKVNRVAIGIAMVAVVAALTVCAWQQTQYWRDSERLWTRALACTSRNYMAHYNLGVYLVENGRPDEAIAHYRETVEIKPDHAEAWNNLGTIFFQQGSFDEAMANYQKAVQFDSSYASAQYNLGMAFVKKGRSNEAMAQFQTALQLNPANADAHYNLARLLEQQGRLDEAKAHYQKTLEIQPGYAESFNSLGNGLREKGRMDEAIAQYQEALRINPGYTGAHVNLGSAQLQQGKTDEAISELQQALRIEPGSAPAHNSLGNALLQKGNVTEAIAQFDKAIELAPADPWIKNNLAWLLATTPDSSLRNGRKAVELAKAATDAATEESPILLHTLAAALAADGRFSEAADTAQRALLLANSESRTKLAAQLESEIKFYEAGQPIHISDLK